MGAVGAAAAGGSVSGVGCAPALGALIPDTQPPAELLGCALEAARAGFDELWVGEDYFCGGGIASAAALLARTELPIGIGVAPVGSRHPAILALELATLAGMYPGRLRAGIGAGVPELAEQIGMRARSPVAAVRDTLRAVRELLSGESVTVAGGSFVADDVALMHPPAQPPPIYVGAGGPRMLALSGAEADGTVLSVLSGRDYVRWARARLNEAGASPEHRLVVYALCALDESSDRARETLRELVAYVALPSPRNALSEVQGFAEEAEELASLGLDAAIPQVPDRWLDELTVAGTVAECSAKVVALLEAGADAVTLCFPPGPPCREMIARAGGELLPSIRRAVRAVDEVVR
jgi:alkanesulfonate monooxygenase SsuD/methylene tetrahydromethanopterin reductase-like flavin-dependent oxidoreductase (luciferase family)